MIMWTVQPMAVYRQLERDGVFRCDITQSAWQDAPEFMAAYRWMRHQMERRIGPAPVADAYPIWGWYRRDWQHKRPDFRYYRDYEDQVCLEIDVPEEQVLLSDFETWNGILNEGYLSGARNEAEFDAGEAWYDALPAQRKQRELHRSWTRVFEIGPVHDPSWWIGKDVQGCIWELRREQIKHVLRVRKGQRMEQLF
ncbi:hypothetical protein VC81_11165 [Levilactobacillus spicheri]|uniref:DUF3841 domain-containing protein n=2 Tax=Levilactobacillus spicheri TaxID=216463 RepID=A0A0F3RPI7_9LACO|nr:hypothetical protein VC81_11165 [Levilactobacillus spicheri]